jgi:hypothetical protein
MSISINKEIVKIHKIIKIERKIGVWKAKIKINTLINLNTMVETLKMVLKAK